MILSKPQAEAVYSAMCALNNIGGHLRRAVFGDFMVSEANDSVTVFEFLEDAWEPCERYESQYMFAFVYGLQQG